MLLSCSLAVLALMLSGAQIMLLFMLSLIMLLMLLSLCSRRLLLMLSDHMLLFSFSMLIMLTHCWYAASSSCSYESVLIMLELPLLVDVLQCRLSYDALSLSQLLMLSVVLVSIMLMLLTTALVQPSQKMLLMLCLMAMLMLSAAFLTADLLLFFLLFEGALLPLAMLVLQCGSRATRVTAAMKLLVYTMLGSTCYAVAIGYLLLTIATCDAQVLSSVMLSAHTERALYAMLMLAMLVKLPIMPLHSWLPMAHAEAPTVGSVLLAAVVLKLSGYGMLRFILPICSHAHEYCSSALEMLAICSLIYGSLLTLCQVDAKRIIACSSIAHMALIVAAFSCCSVDAFAGLITLLVSHGLVSMLLFMLIGMLYSRLHTRALRYIAGCYEAMPIWCSCFFIASLGNLSLPGTAGFTAELLILAASWTISPMLCLLMSLTLMLSGAYSLWLFNRVAHGNWPIQRISTAQDLSRKELLSVSPIVILMLILGLMPNALLKGLLIYAAFSSALLM
nr:NADH dehydrogenase subunit 4 [Bangiopsis subsimplex]